MVMFMTSLVEEATGRDESAERHRNTEGDETVPWKSEQEGGARFRGPLGEQVWGTRRESAQEGDAQNQTGGLRGYGVRR